MVENLYDVWPIWDKFQLCVHSSVLCIWDQISRAGKGCNVVAEQDPPCLAILAAIQISAYTRVTRMHALPTRERRPPRNLKIKPWHCYIEPFKHKVSLHLIWNGILLHLIQSAVSLYLGTKVSFHLILTKISLHKISKPNWLTGVGARDAIASKNPDSTWRGDTGAI